MTRSELEEKVRDFAIDEGILGKTLPPNPKLDFGYELNFPPRSPKPMKILIIKPKEGKAVSLQIPTQIAPQHQEALKKKHPQGLAIFFNTFKRYMLNQNLMYNIDGKNARYIIMENIYPDGFTENHFYSSIRKVFNAAVFSNLLLNDIMSGAIGANKNIGNLTDSNFTQSDTMYS